jgi:hypothetical protein
MVRLRPGGCRFFSSPMPAWAPGSLFWTAARPGVLISRALTQVLAMHRKLSDQVRSCLDRAQECGHKAEHAVNNELREDYIQLQRQWLNLARSHQITERMLSAFYEHDRNWREFLKDES